jgi:hypothetical protein
MKYADRVRESATASGTGNYQLRGAQAGYRTFSPVFSNNDVTEYCAVKGDVWEIGVGKYIASVNQVQRLTIISSSTGSAIAWDAGYISLFCTVNATTASRIASVGPYVIVPGVLEPVIGASVFVMPVEATFLGYEATVATPSAGGSVGFRINKNATQLFTGGVGEGLYTSGETAISATVAKGDRLTIDITSVGMEVQGVSLHVRMML